MNKFSSRSRHEMQGMHPDLIIVNTTALILAGEKGLDWGVFDGIRTQREQKIYVATGVSWTMDSMHLVQEKTGFCHASDNVPYINGKLRWDSIEAFKILGKCMKQASELHGIPIKWGANKKYGGDWSGNKNDMAHFELDRNFYL